MDSDFADSQLSSVAGAIADPARAHAVPAAGRPRPHATELAAAAEIGASTASSHFQRLRDQGLVEQAAQGKHRYYRLANGEVARAGGPAGGGRRRAHAVQAQHAIGAARGAHLLRPHGRPWRCACTTRCWRASGWRPTAGLRADPLGEASLAQIGVDAVEARRRRRRFACPCLDWSERRPHLGGALGAALLDALTERGWVSRDLDSRALRLTRRASASSRRSSAMPARRPSRARIGTSRPVRPRLSALSRLRHSGRGCAMDADWPRP